MILNNSQKGIFAINTGNSAVDLSVAKRIFFGYGKSLLPKFKLAVVSFDIDILFQRYNIEPNYRDLVYRHTPGFAYDESHEFWDKGYPNGLYELTCDAYSINSEKKSVQQDMLGFVHYPTDGWQGNPILADTTYMDAFNKNPADMLLEEVEDFIQEAQKHNIYLIGVIFPQSPDYKKTGAFELYGLRRSVAKEMIEKIRKYEEKYKNFKLMDENKMGNHDYTDEMAMNSDHLAIKGAEQLTVRLDSVIQTLIIDWNK